ncbi:MAG: alpha/beta hydrolase [Flavobacteriales bacterium]|nr:alpha/beta hydrolase [Flavobacteriales bacterium]
MKLTSFASHFLVALQLAIPARLTAQVQTLGSIHLTQHPDLGATFHLSTPDMVLEGLFIGQAGNGKPLLIFIPGSEPVPLYTRMGGVFYPLVPRQLFDQAHYNFLLLSKPGIPAIADTSELDEKYYYLDPATGMPPAAYKAHNNLGFYVNAYEELIAALRESPGIGRIYVVGHSQGARIAAELTGAPGIDKVVFMSADPLGRMAALVDRDYACAGNMDHDGVKLAQALLDPAQADSTYMGDYYSSFQSFSKPAVISISQATVPTLVVYGNADTSCPNCYAWPLLQPYVPCLSVMAFTGYDHNYFDEQRENHWHEVLMKVFQWLDEGE